MNTSVPDASQSVWDQVDIAFISEGHCKGDILQLLLHFRTTQSFGRVSTLWVGGFDCHVLLLQFMIVELCN